MVPDPPLEAVVCNLFLLALHGGAALGWFYRCGVGWRCGFIRAIRDQTVYNTSTRLLDAAIVARCWSLGRRVSTW